MEKELTGSSIPIFWHLYSTSDRKSKHLKPRYSLAVQGRNKLGYYYLPSHQISNDSPGSGSGLAMHHKRLLIRYQQLLIIQALEGYLRVHLQSCLALGFF
jgi:hypothetical protein